MYDAYAAWKTGSGFFDTQNEALLNYKNAIAQNNYQTSSQMQDLGLTYNKKANQYVLDQTNPYGAYQQADTAAQQNSGDRGFGVTGAMKVQAAEMPRYQLGRQFTDLRNNSLVGQQQAGSDYHRAVANAARGAADFGAQNKLYTTPRV